MNGQLTRAVISLVFVGLAALASDGAANSRHDGSIAPVDQIRARWEDRTADERRSVAFLVLQLDARLAAWERLTPTQSREVAMLVRLISERPYPAEPRLRPERVRAVMGDADLPLQVPETTRHHLQIASGLAGDPPEDAAMVAFLAPEETPAAILVLALEALQRDDVSPSLVPAVAALLEHPYRVLSAPSDVGPPDRRYVFPVRAAACRVLKKAGIPCGTRLIPAEDGKAPPTEVVEVDRRALEAFLLEHRN